MHLGFLILLPPVVPLLLVSLDGAHASIAAAGAHTTTGNMTCRSPTMVHTDINKSGNDSAVSNMQYKLLPSQDGAHGHQRQRQVQLPPEVLQQGGVAPLLVEPDTASFASGAGDAVLLTSTGDDDVIDAQASAHLPSTGELCTLRHGCSSTETGQCWHMNICHVGLVMQCCQGHVL